MNRQRSPFAQLTGAEKQIRWLEYQSIRLPYVETTDNETNTGNDASHKPSVQKSVEVKTEKASYTTDNRPQPPPEVPRTMPLDSPRHRQYDAVIARLKQAELQSRRNAAQTVK